MHLTRLCLIVPADVDVEPPPPQQSSPPHSQDQSIKSIHHHGHGHKHTISALLRRTFRGFCTAGQHHRHRFRPCCLSCLSTTNDHSSNVFSDIPGADKATAYDNPRLFSYAELYIGSNGFSDKELLGSGGFGRVYRAVLLSDNTIVAVKCVMNGGDLFEKTFAAELAAVAQLRHRNLVRLRGWCVHDDQLLLVYDYMPNRSLDRILFSSASSTPPLGWRRRERIVAGLAAALFYLHEQLDTQIIHRDVKTSNVMLDSGYNAKLGDFGLARWLEHDITDANSGGLELLSKSSSLSNNQFRLSNTSKIGGTIGYLPPETFHNKKTTCAVTAKSDVFSFGVVVLEVATGRRAVDLSYPDEEILLLDWVRRLADEGKSTNAGDPRLPVGSYSVSDMSQIIHLGLLCSLHDPSSRPTMKWVMEILTGNHSGDLPPLPSFRSHPYNYISFSSSTTTTTTTTNKTEHTSVIFHTANNSTMYLSANDSDSTTIHHHSPPLPPPSPLSSFFPQVDTPREIPFDEIVSITNNFSESNMVAELDFGTGYVGYLTYNFHRRIRVLVKRLGMKTCPALRSRFTNELRNLGRLRHRHLVQLRGWCTEQGEMLVVYDYPSSCTLLSRRLSNTTTTDTVLPWQRRYGILKSLASAILYLHEEWEEQVIHRNITSSAIFLDHDMNPRLGSFALAEFLTRRNHHDNNHHHDASAPSVRGIFGYMAPEYMKTGVATTMADVYSFGVVVLEVVTGKMAVDFRTPEVLLVRRVVEGRNDEEVVDWRLNGECDGGELRRAVEIGMRCTRSAAEERPSMREIVSVLDGNEEVMKGWEGRSGEEREEWGRWNGDALGLIRRIHAIGIQ